MLHAFFFFNLYVTRIFKNVFFKGVLAKKQAAAQDKKQPKHPWQGYEIKKNEHTPQSAGWVVNICIVFTGSYKLQSTMKKNPPPQNRFFAIDGSNTVV